MQGDRIHAIAQARRPRSIVEYMSQMRIAQTAGNCIALHSPAAVGALRDIQFGDRLPKARPPGARLELGLRVIERGVAANAVIDAIPVITRVFARKRSLGALLTRHGIGQCRELSTPLGLALDDLRQMYDALAFAGG